MLEVLIVKWVVKVRMLGNASLMAFLPNRLHVHNTKLIDFQDLKKTQWRSQWLQDRVFIRHWWH